MKKAYAKKVEGREQKLLETGRLVAKERRRSTVEESRREKRRVGRREGDRKAEGERVFIWRACRHHPPTRRDHMAMRASRPEIWHISRPGA